MLTSREWSQTAAKQFAKFMSTLFDRNDLVEIRAIKNLSDGSTKVVDRDWRQAFATTLLHESYRGMNENGANVYFGVNPRTRRDGTKRSINRCRSVWVDLDNVSLDDARDRWLGLLPDPSMVISSGHGIHVYWKLTEPAVVEAIDDRQRFEAMLKCLYADLGADSTQDVNRLLRLPGLKNVKSTPVPCELIYSDGPTVPLSTFNRWFAASDRQHAEPPPPARLASVSLPTKPEVAHHIRQIIATLDRPSDDRSRRDFAVVCKLLRLGLAPTEIKSLVAGHSKFTTTTYSDITLDNAIAAVSDMI